MKNLFRCTLVATGLLLATAGSASAQLPVTVKFTTTFPFMVGHQLMPAGSYTVSPLETDHALLQISNGHDSALLLTEADVPRPSPKQDEVIFTRNGDTYTLREIWDAASATGAETIDTHRAHPQHHDGKV